MTGSEPRSPERTLRQKDVQRRRARRRCWRSRSSRRSSDITGCGALIRPVLRSAGGGVAAAGRVLDAPGAPRHGVVGGAGDGGDQFLDGRVGRRRSPLLRPSRSTTMRSATARTSSMLWLIMMTPSPRSRTRSIRSSTSAVCATPSAAVGSSSMMSLGSSSSERAIATVCRWPPESEATGIAHAGDARRQLVEQRPRPDLHGHLVEPQRTQLAAEEDVGDHVEVLAQRQVLEHGGDAELERGARVGDRAPACR